MALCCSCLALEVCVGSSFKSLSETMLSNGLQAVPYTSHRAYEDQVTFLCLELQESAVGVWATGDFSLTFSSQWEVPHGFMPVRAWLVLAALLPSPLSLRGSLSLPCQVAMFFLRSSSQRMITYSLYWSFFMKEVRTRGPLDRHLKASHLILF